MDFALMDPLFELKNICLQQGDFTLQVGQLTLQPGKLYALEGENGSGKSTLLRVLALIQKPDSGQMRICDRPVSWKEADMRRERQQVTLLEQNPLLFTGTVEQNLAFGLKIRGIHGRPRQERIEQALATTGLSGFSQRLCGELSGGESRRAALARALVLRPQLLLLDEPTANLDAEQVAALERFLLTLPEQGISVVIATHDRRQPERLGGEILHLRDGQLSQEGLPAQRAAASYPKLQSLGELL